MNRITELYKNKKAEVRYRQIIILSAVCLVLMLLTMALEMAYLQEQISSLRVDQRGYNSRMSEIEKFTEILNKE